MEKENQALDIERLRQQTFIKEYQSAELPIPETLIADHMSLIRSLAVRVVNRKQLPSSIDEDDVISWGVEGLLKAYRSFKSAKGSRFSTYAYYRIKGEIFDRIRQEWNYRNPASYQDYRKNIQSRIADFIDNALQSGEGYTPDQLTEYVQSVMSGSAMVGLISLDGLEETSGGIDRHLYQHSVSEGDLVPEQLWEVISQLEPEEQTIIKLLYVEDKTQREVALLLNYSNSKLCRIHIRILEKIKRRLKAPNL